MAERRSFSQPPAQQRPIVRIVLLAVLAVGFVMVISAFINPPASRQPVDTTLPVTTTNASLPSVLEDLSPLTAGMAMIDEPLATEPAGLPAWPGEGAKRAIGFRRPLGDRVDEVAFWRLPSDASPADVVAFYDAAATAMKFQRVDSATATSPNAASASVIYHRRTDLGLQTLTLRTADTPEGLRVTLWFQYPIATPVEPPSVSTRQPEALNE
jgi:hypothetical protein